MRNFTSGSFLVAKETKKTIFYVYVKRMLIYQHFFISNVFTELET